jgi:hypothetical protein
MQMTQEPIQFPTRDPIQWARSHPSFFFNAGTPSDVELIAQLVMGAKILGATHIEFLAFESWSIVASETDWFMASVRFPIDENLKLEVLTPFPELGQNCTRPESILLAFAKNIVTLGPSGVHLVAGDGLPSNSVCTFLSSKSEWRRAIAFAGLYV